MCNALVKEIIRRQTGQIRTQIAKVFRNKEDQKDVYQEVVIHIMKNIHKYDPEHPNANLAGWISRLVGNKCISIIRSQKKGLNYQDFEDDSLIDNYRDNSLVEEDFDPSIRSIKTINIEKLLLQLNERDRQIIILRLFKCTPIKEIDKIMGLTNSSIYYKRAIERLREFEDADSFFDYFDDFEPE